MFTSSPTTNTTSTLHTRTHVLRTGSYTLSHLRLFQVLLFVSQSASFSLGSVFPLLPTRTHTHIHMLMLMNATQIHTQRAGQHHFFPGTAVLNAAGTQAFHWHDTWKENVNVFSLIIPLFR